jgi:hypothetical protein
MPSRATMARLALVPALTAALLAACSDGPAAQPGYVANEAAQTAAAGPTDEGAVADWPAIHLDQVHELVVEGANAAQRDYRFALARCRETGWPVRELTAAELERLGTTRVRIWASPTLEVVRDEQWTLGLEDGAPVDSCLFRLEHGGRYSYADGSVEMSRALGDDAAAGDSAEPVAGGEILPRFPLDPSAGGADGFEAIGERQVAGQACRAWRGRSVDGEIEQCLWSGGRSFGFDDQAVGEGCSPARPVEASLEAIVLAQEPVDGKGCRIRTRNFTVGDALDRDAYAPPPAGAGA